MIPRQITRVLRRRLASYPAVALVGPRQSGKTTLATSFAGQYFDIEQESDRLRVDIGWERLTQGTDLVIFDEAQAWPELFTRLRGAIDRNRSGNGRFLLLGSVSPSLMTRVSESLAGRLALVELTPITASELEDPTQLRRHWLVGGFADGGIVDGARFPVWQQNYLDLLVQRDLPTWGLPAHPRATNRLVRMLASVHGQEWNASQISRSMALSYHTVNRYLDYLEGAFLVRRLPAWHGNIRKRLVKRPKVYWRDTGLLHALQQVANRDELLRQPWVGASWEGYVVEQILAALQHRDLPFDASYLRTSDRREIDLLVRVGTELWAIETKLTTNPSRSHLARLDANADLIGADRRFLVCYRSGLVDEGSRIVCDVGGILTYIGAFRSNQS